MRRAILFLLALQFSSLVFAWSKDRPDLLNVFDSAVMPIPRESEFFISTEFERKPDTWSGQWPESLVFHAQIVHSPGKTAASADDKAWEIRIGKGGQIYSISGPFPEAIPPQSKRDSPWVDEVLQLVALSTRKHSKQNKYFIHQAGVYLRDKSLKRPFYSPLLAFSADVHERTYRILNWPQQAHIPTDHKSDLLFFTQVRDLGSGVLEIQYVVFNFGEDPVDRFNAPFLGLRLSSLPSHFYSTPEGGIIQDDIMFYERADKRISETGGWAIFVPEKQPFETGLAVVFGSHQAPTSGTQWGEGTWRYGRAGGRKRADQTKWRNTQVGTVVRRFILPPGDSAFFNFYLVFAEPRTAQSIIESRNLLTNAKWGIRVFDTDSAPCAAVFVMKQDGDYSLSRQGPPTMEPTFTVLTVPVRNSVPLFLIRSRHGSTHLSTSPYAFSEVPYDGTSEILGLVGYALRNNPQSLTSFAALSSKLDKFPNLMLDSSHDLYVPNDLNKCRAQRN